MKKLLLRRAILIVFALFTSILISSCISCEGECEVKDGVIDCPCD